MDTALMSMQFINIIQTKNTNTYTIYIDKGALCNYLNYYINGSNSWRALRSRFDSPIKHTSLYGTQLMPGCKLENSKENKEMNMQHITSCAKLMFRISEKERQMKRKKRRKKKRDRVQLVTK